MRPLLGAILAERGLIDPERLAEALTEAQATHRRVGEVLLQKGWLYEQELARALAHQYELEYVDLHMACLKPQNAALLAGGLAIRGGARSRYHGPLKEDPSPARNPAHGRRRTGRNERPEG
jgi:hypothetical protein